jgi:GAF domain-containing protein
MPLIIRDKVVGTIFLENHDQDRAIDLEEENLFNQISIQISAAMESARLFAAEQEGRIAAAALLEITQIASASLEMNQVLQQATNRSAQAIQAHRCTIFLLDEKEKIKPLISIYADGREMPEDEWELLQDKVHQTYENIPLHHLAANLRTPKIISSPLTYQNIPLSWAVDFGIENMLMVPLISQNKVIGTMIFDQIDQNQTFKQNQEELAQTIAGQIATTIENANLFEQTVRRAERERKVTEITSKIRSSNDPQKIMETAISELRLALNKSSSKAKTSQAKNQKQSETNPPSNGKDKAQN